MTVPRIVPKLPARDPLPVARPRAAQTGSEPLRRIGRIGCPAAAAPEVGPGADHPAISIEAGGPGAAETVSEAAGAGRRYCPADASRRPRRFFLRDPEANPINVLCKIRG